jgi:hypothetical protein
MNRVFKRKHSILVRDGTKEVLMDFAVYFTPRRIR